MKNPIKVFFSDSAAEAVDFCNKDKSDKLISDSGLSAFGAACLPMTGIGEFKALKMLAGNSP